ncbi:MAG: YggS family pyridoxal phosphate-dependent enzyme [Anaerolineae bacterium]|nr:YggS family pyridoxal phosphate-dependent enzyme [Anaerolineae bacterium]
MRDACERANRSTESVTLVAVSKTHPAEAVVEAFKCGLRHFGENRVEEASQKIPRVRELSGTEAERITWHMIGHVQSRKAEEVVGIFDTIHSLDTIKLAERYSRFAVEAGKNARVLLEVNVSGEESKSGFEAAGWQHDTDLRNQLWDAVRKISALPHLRLEGLMTMAPIVEEMEQTRPVFAALRQLRDALAADFPQWEWQSLSMGMTDDFPIAIEEGATLIRVGRAIFGDRAYT